MSKRLTVNLGLRYEYVSPLAEKFNRWATLDIQNRRVIIASEDGQTFPQELWVPGHRATTGAAADRHVRSRRAGSVAGQQRPEQLRAARRPGVRPVRQPANGHTERIRHLLQRRLVQRGSRCKARPRRSSSSANNPRPIRTCTAPCDDPDPSGNPRWARRPSRPYDIDFTARLTTSSITSAFSNCSRGTCWSRRNMWG